jgi:hypothetical protein
VPLALLDKAEAAAGISTVPLAVAWRAVPPSTSWTG